MLIIKPDLGEADHLLEEYHMKMVAVFRVMEAIVIGRRVQ